MSTRTALVTGASRGIGAAVARRLGADGVAVAVHYAHRADAARDVVRTVEDAGGRAFAFRAVLGDGADDGVGEFWAAFDRACADDGRDPALDVLVNNVGTTLPGAFPDATRADFDRMVAVNLRTPFFLTQQALPRLRPGARVVTLSSAVTRLALTDAIAYAATKGAVDVFTKVLAKELGPRGITVNAVAPGWTDTDPNAAVLRDDPVAAAEIAAQTALGRFGRPDDVAAVVAFLVGPDGGWVTGQVVDASGGTRL